MSRRKITRGKLILYIIGSPFIIIYKIIQFIYYFIIALIETKNSKKSYEEQSTNKNLTLNNKCYHKKNLITDCEKEYYYILRKIIKTEYIIQPQIPLSSIVKKEQEENWKTPLELYRTIDFGILDENFDVLFVIEINDQTHYKQKRIERDQKVKEILSESDIPLVTLWTEDGKSENFIKAEIERQITKCVAIVK